MAEETPLLANHLCPKKKWNLIAMAKFCPTFGCQSFLLFVQASPGSNQGMSDLSLAKW
jgi:hypothetical protein